MPNDYYNLFLDDYRQPTDVKWIELPPVKWIVVKNYDEFIETIKQRGMPARISLDHDTCPEHYAAYTDLHDERFIGEKRIRYETFKEKTGYDVAKWLANYCIDRKLLIPEYYIHTLNPIGAMNIFSVLENARIMLTENHN